MSYPSLRGGPKLLKRILDNSVISYRVDFEPITELKENLLSSIENAI